MNSIQHATEASLTRVVTHVTLPQGVNLYHYITASFSWHGSFVIILFLHLHDIVFFFN